MRQSMAVVCSAAVLLLVGCQQQQSDMKVATVSVRFAMPPSVERYALAPTVEFSNTDEYGNQQQEYVAADGDVMEYSHTEGNTDVYTVDENSQYAQTASAPSVTWTRTAANYDEMNALAHAERYHVTMWGGPYQGQVVTHRDLDLSPGDYTFALWEQDPATTVQGNLHVNAPNSALLDVLQNWQARIPELKRQLAYDAEIQGQANTDAEAFKSFQRQLKALDKLSSKINRAVWWEQEWRERNAPAYEEFVNEAVVLLLPGDEREIDPRTRPAFCVSDIDNVHTGDPLTKVIMVADYNTARWKTKQVDELTREFNVCKAVLWEEVARFERRKRILNITDHIYKHDREFVANEYQLQTALATIDAINDELGDLSERRVALAYATALTAPDEPSNSLDSEQRDLEQERVVLSAEKDRLDAMYQTAGRETPKRVDLEAARQRYARAIEGIDQRLGQLADDRLALSKLRDASQVLHRQSHDRVLAASIVGEDIPFRVRQAIGEDALITVRMQSQDNLFAPKGKGTGVAAQTASWNASDMN